jgi:hypothetical protein
MFVPGVGWVGWGGGGQLFKMSTMHPFPPLEPHGSAQVVMIGAGGARTTNAVSSSRDHCPDKSVTEGAETPHRRFREDTGRACAQVVVSQDATAHYP